MKKSKKLNLGCGIEIKKDYINLDWIKSKGVDIVYDLNKVPYPFKNNAFEKIYASHILEHLEGNWFEIIKELTRILEKEGVLIVKVPHFSSPGAFLENHKRFFRYRSFEPYNEQKTMKGLDQIKRYKLRTIYKKINFIKFPLIYNFFIEWLVNLSKSASLIYENTFLKSLFPANEIVFKLKKCQVSV